MGKALAKLHEHREMTRIPVTTDDFRDVEDRLGDLMSRFRDLRRRVDESGVEHVQLNFKTFGHLLKALEDKVNFITAEVETRLHAQALAERRAKKEK